MLQLTVVLGGGSIQEIRHEIPSLLPLAAIALAGSIGAATAAEHNAMSKSSAMSSTASMAKDRSSRLHPPRKSWPGATSAGVKQREPSNFTASAGTTVPSDIRLRPIPRKVASQLPTLKPYRYARLPNEILIVNPTDKKVVDVINRHA